MSSSSKDEKKGPPAPSSKRNHVRDPKRLSVCDESAQTSMSPPPSLYAFAQPCPAPAPLDPTMETVVKKPVAFTSPSPNKNKLYSEDAVCVRSQLAESILKPLQKSNQDHSVALGSIDNSIVKMNNSMMTDNMKIVRSLDAVCESNKDGSALITATMEKINARNSYDLQRMYDALLANNEVVSKLVDFLTDKKNEDEKPSHSKHDTVEDVPSPSLNIEENHVATSIANNKINENDYEDYEYEDYDEYQDDSHQDSDKTNNKDNIYKHPNYYQSKSNPPVMKNQGPIMGNNSAAPAKVPVSRNNQATSSTQNNSKNSTSRFNMNEFSIALQGKVKFNDMDKYIDKIVLQDDSMFQLKDLYSRIILAISYGFIHPVQSLPTFRDLDQDISFKEIFLDRLIDDATIAQVTSMYNRIGETIKLRLTDKECISNEKCPRAYKIICLYCSFSGWRILESLLKERLVKCGAVPDNDLDSIRTSMSIMKNESYDQFYIRLHQLQVEYEHSMKSIWHVPYIKLLSLFMSELLRAPEYVPYLLPFLQKLYSHIRMHGDMDTTPGLPFTIHEVHQHMKDNWVPEIPTLLTPKSSSNNQPSNAKTVITPYDDNTVIASVEMSQYEDIIYEIARLDDEVAPNISAMNRMNKIRCKCCLIGFHPPEQCYIRGLNFLPPALRKRVMLYNKQHGDKPPPGTALKDWNPRSIPAIHTDKKKVQFANQKKEVTNPFKNTATKVRTRSPTITALEQNENVTENTDDQLIEEIIQDEDLMLPSYNSFISQQESEAKTFTMQEASNDDDFCPVTCAFSSGVLCAATRDPNVSITFEPTLITTSNPVPSQVDKFTPSKIQDLMLQVHSQCHMQPNKRFLTQHAKAISTLPSSAF